MQTWDVYKHGDNWKIGAAVAHVVLSGAHPAEELDAQLARWGMKRTHLGSFESDEARAEFEAVFGRVGPESASADRPQELTIR
jgi:hypothetical protein